MVPLIFQEKKLKCFFDFIQRQSYDTLGFTMNSRNQQQQQQPRVRFEEYTHTSEDFQGNGQVSHQWKYAEVPATTAAADPRLTLRQYYELEEKHCPSKADRAHFKLIQTALPRQFAIVAATRQPRQFVSRTQSCILSLQGTPTQTKIQSRARARVHTTCDITPFTELTLHQRAIVIARSGLAHLLIKKLAGVFCDKPYIHRRTVLAFADLIASFISSALACEYLIGNRYYRNLPVILAGEFQVVGCIPHTQGSSNTLAAEEVTPAKIQETAQELQSLYDANIDRLEATIAQYARGFVSLESLRTDPDFVKMFSKFWRLSFQTMKARLWSESRIAALRANNPRGVVAGETSADRVIMCRQIFSAQCQFSRLIQYNVAHLFDNSTFGYASLLRSAKSSQLRLCNDGLTAGLLTFATIEPRMVTAWMVPMLDVNYVSCDLSGAANHIQSRDPVFGEILAKHRQHVHLVNEAYATNGIWRSWTLTAQPTSYIPLQSRLDSIRSGGERSCMEKPERRGAPPPGLCNR